MPADIFDPFGIVIARNPVPLAAGLQLSQGGAVRIVEARTAAAVMKAVAERNHAGGIATFDHFGEFRDRRLRVVRRQHHAARTEERRLLKMQVGDDQRSFVGPICGAAAVGDETGRPAGQFRLWQGGR